MVAIQHEVVGLDALNTSLEKASPAEILGWALTHFRDRICLQSSMQRRSSVIAHMMWANELPTAPMVFVDTGYHFAETLKTRDELRQRYGMEVLTVYPDETPEAQTEQYGEELWRSPDSYRTCCDLRKVRPWVRVASRFDAIVSGLQRAEGGARAEIPVVAYDPRLNAFVVHPLANLTNNELESYIIDHEVYLHPLYDAGFPSIGCATCTTPVRSGEDVRAGRWRHIREALDHAEEKLYCNINWVDQGHT